MGKILTNGAAPENSMSYKQVWIWSKYMLEIENNLIICT